VAVFDPARIADRSTYEDLHRYALGVSNVMVNGQVVVDGGYHTARLRVLRRGTCPSTFIHGARQTTPKRAASATE
jgi:hypothetical protein